ncbi:hypothetical protein LF41_1666 [Lysobacter dokdonensis DS-58]|uniref:Uncharacterized protein n=1 Tax=Lysobacter dokdonensis DS-58 TaxID=1300345 RepID=A0A0A2WDM1_9GAMM|nr:hypothetical protein LF41_1666 [Lysobacter dokdonensis DS-58]
MTNFCFGLGRLCGLHRRVPEPLPTYDAVGKIHKSLTCC